MSNVVKALNAAVDGEEKHVINSNSMVAERLKLLRKVLGQEEAAEDFSTDGFSAGLNAEAIDGILFDPDGEPGEGNVIKAEAPEPQVDLAAVSAEAEQILEDARAQADQLIQEAMDQAEAGRAQIYEEARQQGYNEGYNQGMAEVDGMKAELAEQEQAMMAEYEQMVADIEPAMIDMLSDIYGHVFGIDLADKKEVIFYLLQNALQNADTTANLMIHVSKDDYEYISSHKSRLFEGIPGEDNTDIVPDITLSAGQAMIDTGSGIFDCSVGVELEGLRKQIQILSYKREVQ